METRIQAPAAADAAQLREELAAWPAVVVNDADSEGLVFVDIPDGVDALAVAQKVARHFPRRLIEAITSVNFEGAATVDDLKARCIEFRDRAAQLLTAVWS